MWCERVVRNAGDGAGLDGRTVDYVDINWDECRHVLKKRTRGGEDLRVLLPRDQRISHGDVVFEDESRAIVINVIPSEVIVARPDGERQAALLALELGNLHWPTQLGDGEIMCLEDGPVMEVLEALKIPWSKEVRRFLPTEVRSMPAVKLASGFQVIRGKGGRMA